MLQSKVIPARGIVGELCTLSDGTRILRVYDDTRENWTDYDIVHSDVKIQIVDDDAVLRDNILIESDKTLGRTSDSAFESEMFVCNPS